VHYYCYVKVHLYYSYDEARGKLYQQRVEIKAGLEYQFKEANVHCYGIS
jgi:hypothetical protein